jgi:polyisoprenoid-binding protein YceI
MSLHSRLNTRTILPVVALTLSLPAIAWMRTAEPMTMQAESRIWVDGKSSIRDWSCKALDVNAAIDASPSAVAQVAAGEKGIRTVRITVPADKMECGNGTMNEHMKKALKVDENPTIVFKLTSYDVARTAAGSAGTLKGMLTLGGVQKAISIPAEGKTEGVALRVTGAVEVIMTDYDLTPPSLMFGRIKVRDPVTVNFDLLLKS